MLVLRSSFTFCCFKTKLMWVLLHSNSLAFFFFFLLTVRMNQRTHSALAVTTHILMKNPDTIFLYSMF